MSEDVDGDKTPTDGVGVQPETDVDSGDDHALLSPPALAALGHPAAATVVDDGESAADTLVPDDSAGRPDLQSSGSSATKVLGNPSAQTLVPSDQALVPRDAGDAPLPETSFHPREPAGTPRADMPRAVMPQSAGMANDQVGSSSEVSEIDADGPSSADTLVPPTRVDMAPTLEARYHASRQVRIDEHRSSSASLTGDDLRALSEASIAEKSGQWAHRRRLLQARSALDWDRDFQERYDLQHAIGSGGVSDVFLGTQQSLCREVAIKVGGVDGGSGARRFRAESMVTAYLEHPNIIPVYDAGDCFLVMKRIQGQSLEEVIARRPVESNDLPRLIDVMVKVCDAIAYAHGQGVVHRDLKASNIMVGQYGEVLVLDWGLAARAASRTLHSGPTGWRPDQRVYAGTPACMAPEVAGRHGTIGPWIDSYNIGGILYHVLTGRMPFSFHIVDNETTTVSVDESLSLASENRYLPIEDLNPRAPRMLAELQRQAMATEVRQRPSVSEVADTLRRWIRQADAEVRAFSALDEGRNLLKAANAYSRKEWDAAFKAYVAAVAAFDRSISLMPDLGSARRGRQQAMDAFAHAALRSGSFHLARMLAQGYSVPMPTAG